MRNFHDFFLCIAALKTCFLRCSCVVQSLRYLNNQDNTFSDDDEKKRKKIMRIPLLLPVKIDKITIDTKRFKISQNFKNCVRRGPAIF